MFFTSHARALMTLVAVVGTLAAASPLSASAVFLDPARAGESPEIGTIVRFELELFDGNAFVTRTFDLGLFDTETPASVQNFLNYVTDGDYDASIFHRSVPGFVIQGGSFTVEEDLTPGVAEDFALGTVPLDDPIDSEEGISNTRGTIAYALLGDGNDTATSGFFINTVDNDGNETLNNLDTLNGGFTVFGEVVDGLDVIDEIAALPIFNASGAFSELPLQAFDNTEPVAFENFVTVTSVTIIPEPATLALLGLGLIAASRRRVG